MPNLSPVLFAMFLGSAVFQVLGIALLPATKGLTQIMPTIGAAACFIIGVGLMARLNHSGVNLSLLIPLMATAIPLCTALIGVFAYGESASLLKVGMLVVACLIIGAASAVP